MTKSLLYDRSGDQHHDAISPFYKSVRGSDLGAVLYYLARMLQPCENPLVIVCCLIMAVSEDVGLTNNALQTYATSVYLTTVKVGMKDTLSTLAQLVLTICLSKMSN